MDHFTHSLHVLVTSCASIASNLVEIIAVFLIIYTVGKTIRRYIVEYQMDFHKMHTDDGLIRGISVALEVLLAGEILKTITASNRDTLVEIFLIILMRVFMTIVVRWEESSKEDNGHIAIIENTKNIIEEKVKNKKVKKEVKEKIDER